MKNPWQYAETNSEHGHQTALFMWASVAKQIEPRLDLLFAIPNGGKRDSITASRLKAEGVKAGVPDIMLPVKSMLVETHIRVFRYNGLFIELKRPKSIRGAAGKEGDKQSPWIERLREEGYHAAVCVGWLEAKQVIFMYLGYISRDEQNKIDAYVMDKWPKGKTK